MILVTGANGFIGSVLVRDLNRKGCVDLILTDYIDLETRQQLLEGSQFKSFFNPDDFLDQLKEFRDLEAVFHMGACSDTTETNWEYLKKVNLDYSKRLFSHCAEFKIPFLYASSGAVYGDGASGFSDLADPTRYKALNLYGRSKQEFDKWALEQKEAPPVWYGFRFFNVYGPNEYFKDSMASLAFKAFDQIRESSSLRLFRSHNPKYKDGEQLRDFVYVKDISRWCLEYLETKKAPNGIYNLGYGKARTWLDLATPIFECLGKPINIDWIDVPENIRDQYQYFTEAEMSRHHGAGMSEPEWPLEAAVKDYVLNYLSKAKKVY